MDSIIYNGVEYRRFDRLYWVSANGHFLRKMEPYTPWSMPNGYLAVGRRGLAHRIVATCWCRRPEGAEDVHHINHDKTDNRAENLEWLTTADHLAKHPELGRQPMPEAARAKLRAYRLGRKTSEETKQKQREANLRLGIKPPARPLGTKMGHEFSAVMKGKSHNIRACVVKGVRYRSFNEAGEALGIKPHTLRKRCLSENFPEYQLSD